MQMDIEEHSATPILNSKASNTHYNDLNTNGTAGLQVIKRNGDVTDYRCDKISIAITKAFLAVEGSTADASNRIHDSVQILTEQVSSTFKRRMPSGGTIHIEQIQDQVELVLMRSEEHKVAQAYVIYRAEHARHRAKEPKPLIAQDATMINIIDYRGHSSPLSILHLNTIINEACDNLDSVNPDAILQSTLEKLYDGASANDVRSALEITTINLIEHEPNYTFVAARLLLASLRQEALDFLNLSHTVVHADMHLSYPQALEKSIDKGIELKLLSSELRRFDLTRLGQALDSERDLQFTYTGLKTLYDSYFIRSNELRFELPQIFFMRVAMGLALEEDDINARAIEFYRLLSSFDYMSSSPTLLNAGTLRPQLSGCYVSSIPDDLHGIFSAMQDNVMLSKWSAGLGNDWTPVRAAGAKILGTNSKSQGILPFLNIAHDSISTVKQGDIQRGAVCAYLESWHLDIENFLCTSKEMTAKNRHLNKANWIPDLFMTRVFNNKKWTLFSPDEVPDLRNIFGQAFEERYTAYEKMAVNGDIQLYKTINAQDLWRKMLAHMLANKHSSMTFKDPCNIRSPQQHAGIVHSSNLCTGVTLNSSVDEVAACSLGSINLSQHIINGTVNRNKLAKTTETAIRMLDNAIDINYYAVKQAHSSNMRHRPIGLGLMGFHDALYQLDISFASEQAVKFADESMELLSYFAISASANLAQERGTYSSYEGSLWSQGILPIDSIQMLAKQRGAAYLKMNESLSEDWTALRNKIKEQGMRNSNVMAITPTTDIANITSASQSIEPTDKNLSVQAHLSGDFTTINPYLVAELKEHGLWDSVMIHDLKYFDGSVKAIKRIPDHLQEKYASAFELETQWLIDLASCRQKWIDQSQSCNLYICEANIQKIDSIYRMAWLKGLKTTYHLKTGSGIQANVPEDKELAAEQQIFSLENYSFDFFQ